MCHVLEITLSSGIPTTALTTTAVSPGSLSVTSARSIPCMTLMPKRVTMPMRWSVTVTSLVQPNSDCFHTHWTAPSLSTVSSAFPTSRHAH